MLNGEILKAVKNDRFLGFIPLLFISWTFMFYLKEGRADEILWICNVSNYLLGISLFLSWAPGIWISTLWILIGTPLWIFDAIYVSSFESHSFFTHLGSSTIGLFACYHHPVKNKYWLKAFVFLLLFQFIARLFTHPIYNVNGAFRTYDSQIPYGIYWLIGALIFNLILYVIECLIRQFVFSKRTL